MTESRGGRRAGRLGGRLGGRCAWCGRAFATRVGAGRPRRYCRRSCRQREYEARRRAQELGLGEDELVVAREQLESLRDRMYVLACAVEDVERDLRDRSDDPDDVRRALDWLLDAARHAGEPAVPS